MLERQQLTARGLAMYLTTPCGCDFGYDVAARAGNGRRYYFLACAACGRSCGGQILHAKLTADEKANAVVADDRVASRPACARCGSKTGGVELHHWAPFSRFTDFHLWPTAPLCRACHRRWHETMNGYVWGPRC